MTSMLQNPTTVTTTYLTISASPTGKPRKACLHVSRVQGGGNAALPTTVNIGGQVAAKQGGFPDGSFSRLTEAVYALTETQIGLMSNSNITLTGGNFGGQLLTAFVLDDVNQDVPANSGYVHNPTAVTSGSVPLTRSAGSITYYGILIPTLTTPTMSNPSADGNQQGSGAQMTYGWQTEASDGTSNCSYTSTSQLSGQLAINFPSPLPSLVSLDGTTNPAEWEFPDEYIGLEIVTANMGVITGGSVYSRAIAVQSASGNNATVDLPQRVDGMTWVPELPYDVTLAVSDDEENQATGSITLLLQDNESVVNLSDANTSDVGFITYAIDQLGYSVADGVKLIYDNTIQTIYPNGYVIATSLASSILWHIDGNTWNSFEIVYEIPNGDDSHLIIPKLIRVQLVRPQLIRPESL